jgi:CPA2 family monovalent cation:H+ antiporter-2
VLSTILNIGKKLVISFSPIFEFLYYLISHSLLPMEELHALQPAIILLLVGILAILIMRRLQLSPIVGYLLAGMLIGPHGFGLIQESSSTHLLAELGVVFLLFDIGLHFSLAHIWEARRDILVFGPIQVGTCTIAFAALGATLGLELGLAIIVGATLALSSTAVAVQTLAESGQQNCPIGLTATAVLIFQDICAIFLLILANSIAGDGGMSLPVAMILAALKAALAFAAAILIGRYFIKPLFHLLGKARNEEIFTAIALLIVLITAAATGLLGLSLTLGAFLGGMIISETPYRHLIQTEVKPFRGLLLGFFFITVGMSLHIDVLFREWENILLVLVLLMSFKAVLIGLAAFMLHTPLRIAIQLGFLLSQGSEFAFVILGIASLQKVLGAGTAAILITAVAASMALTPSLTNFGYWLAKRLANRTLAAQQTAESSSSASLAPVIIFGMGEVGRCVADGLEVHGIAYTAIEMDHTRFIKANADGYPVAFGDAADLRLMETFQLDQRPTIVVTVVRYEISKALTPIVRERYPHLVRFVAVESDEEKQQFAELGMHPVINRSIPKGLDLAAAVLKAHHVSDEKVTAWMQQRQNQALQTISAQEAVPVAS